MSTSIFTQLLSSETMDLRIIIYTEARSMVETL